MPSYAGSLAVSYHTETRSEQTIAFSGNLRCVSHAIALSLSVASVGEETQEGSSCDDAGREYLPNYLPG